MYLILVLVLVVQQVLALLQELGYLHWQHHHQQQQQELVWGRQ
jgi:hypothetical protein